MIKANKVNLNCEKQLCLSPPQIIDSFLAPPLALNYASTFESATVMPVQYKVIVRSENVSYICGL